MTDPALITERIIEPAGVTVGRATSPTVARPLFEFAGEDVLEVTSWNSAAGVRLAIQGRVYGDNGLVPYSAKHTPATDRSATTTIITMPRGELLNTLVYCEAGSPAIGQTGVRVAVRRGAGGAFERLGVLIQGVVTATQTLAFPGSPVKSFFEAEPFLRVITGTQPAAGGELSESCPTGARWELISLVDLLTTSGAAPIRNPRVRIGTVAVSSAVAIAAASFGPSVSWLLAWGQGMAPTADGASLSQHMPLPVRAMLRAGDLWATTTVSIQAGDQYGQPVYSVREWLDP